MNFYDRYIGGEDGRLVYSDIYALKEKAFEDQYFTDVNNVLIETFKRVSVNLEVIYEELKEIDYNFKTVFQFNFERPLLKPLANTEELWIELERNVEEFGYLPYSLKLFFSIVGSCNFAWDYKSKSQMYWQYADPIQINSLDDIVSFVCEDDWKQYLNDIIAEDNLQIPQIELAADYFHKDNVSGGSAYSIEITKNKSIDGLFLNEQHQTTFIDYLRICIENCGFSNITNPKYNNDYQAFFERVYPKLIAI